MRIRSGCLAMVLSLVVQASPSLRLDGGPFLPYRINHATATSSEGLFGSVELLGQRWDGTRVPLFRTHVTARSQAVELVFYLDEDIRGLELQVDGQGMEEPVSIDLAASEGKSGAVDESETVLRNRMRGLDPPIHLAPDGDPPQRFSMVGSDPIMAGFQASYALFSISVSRAPLVPLGGFILVTMFAAAITPSTRRRQIIARAITIFVVLGVTVAIVFLAVPRPTLFSVAFPTDRPDARISGVLERRIEELPGYTRVTYAAGQGEGFGAMESGNVELVGLWAPAGRGVPMADIVPSGSLVRFSVPPLATLLDGELMFGSKDFVTGWVVHASR